MKILKCPGCGFLIDPKDIEKRSLGGNHHDQRWLRCPSCYKNIQLKLLVFGWLSFGLYSMFSEFDSRITSVIFLGVLFIVIGLMRFGMGFKSD